MGLMNDDKVLVTWRGLCFGQRIILTNTYLVIGDINAATTVEQDLANISDVIAPAGVDDKTTRLLAAYPPQMAVTEIRVQRLRPVRSAYHVHTLAGVVGTNAGAATVANDSAAITMRTPFAGKMFRATKHFGPVPDAASAAGLITAAYRAKLVDVGAALLEVIQPAGTASFLAPGVFNPPTGNLTLFTNFLIGDQARVQRRRTVGVGE